MTRWVELRVHGVSGTPPESLLGVPHVKQVAGDDYSRFFVPDPEPTDHVVEAYHWGRFTSGSWRQSLTLLLVPLGIINATQFMLPKPLSRLGKLLHAIAGACLRTLALVLTYLFTFALSLILVDLIAWRWADHARLLKHFDDGTVLQVAVGLCVVGVLLLSWMGFAHGTRKPEGQAVPSPDSSALGGAFYDVDPNALTLRLLHLAAAFALIALLADLARTGLDSDDDGGPMRKVLIAGIAIVCAVVVLLGDPEKGVSVDWGPARKVPDAWHAAVRWIAPAFALAALGLVVVEIVRLRGVDRPKILPDEAQRLVDFDHVADGLMYGGIAAMGLLYVAVVALLWRGNRFRWSWREAGIRGAELVPLVALLVGALTVNDLQARPVAVTVLAASILLLLWCLWRADEPDQPDGPGRDDLHYFRPYAGGTTPFLLAAIAIFLGIGFSASAATAVSSTLELDVNDAKIKVGTTPMLDRVAYAWGLTIAAAIVVLIVVVIRFLITMWGYRTKIRGMYAVSDDDPTELPDGWLWRVVRATYVGQLKNHLPGIAITFAVVGLAISLVQGYESQNCKADPLGPVKCPHAAGWLDWLSQPRSGAGSIFLINIGAWLFVTGAGLVVTISRGAFKDTGLRRGINIVWDVFSFWPHAVHPFVPRPYSRWTVLELRNRIRHHLGKAGDPAASPHVVVCAHSQGTLISFAAMMQLTEEERDRIAFLSCGSQLRVIYPRAFPAYVNLASVRWLFDALHGRWVNLYRITDPLAGPVLSWNHVGTQSHHLSYPESVGPADDVAGPQRSVQSGNDWRLADPVVYDANCEDGPVDAIHGHHNYWLDDGWRRALDHLRSAPPS